MTYRIPVALGTQVPVAFSQLALLCEEAHITTMSAVAASTCSPRHPRQLAGYATAVVRGL